MSLCENSQKRSPPKLSASARNGERFMAITKRDIEKARKADEAAGPRVTAARYRRVSNKIEVEYDNGVTVAVPVSLIQDFTLLRKTPPPAGLSKIEIWGDGRDI